jgi:hypothetical protein
VGILELSAPGIIELPEVDSGDPGAGGSGWIVTVFDNDINTVEEVMMILMAATQCDIQEAEIETWEIHHLGKSVVHHGGEDDCQEIGSMIATIGIRVEVTCE